MPPRERAAETTAEFVAGSSLVEALGGIAAVVLPIIGLAGLLPTYLAAIAILVLGAALVLEGGALVARSAQLLPESGGGALTSAGFGSGTSAEFLGGVAGVVLGILSLLGVAPMVLMPVAAIVLGAALMLGSGVTSRVNCLRVARTFSGHELARRVGREAVQAAASAQVLAGLGAVILGILGVIGLHTVILTLVAMLCLGGSLLLSGLAVSSRMYSLLAR